MSTIDPRNIIFQDPEDDQKRPATRRVNASAGDRNQGRGNITPPSLNSQGERGDTMNVRMPPPASAVDFPVCPVNGIHTWVMDAAWHCRKMGLNAAEAVRLIHTHDGSLRRNLQPREAVDAVEKAFSAKLDSSVRFERVPELPTWNAVETARLHREMGTTNQDMIDASPERDLESFHPRGILERLFPDPDGLICIGESAYSFLTAPLRDHSRLRQKQFITPAFMLSTHGETKTGKLSMHAKSNTGPRRFIVCDFDEPAPEQHPSIIMHLTRFRPLTMALSSGGRSLHAWFPTTTSIEDDRLFWRLCIGLGADPALFRNPSQFVRMPNATRDNGNRQSVVFFNPPSQQ